MQTHVIPLSPSEACARVREGSLTLVDVRPLEERALSAVPVPYEVLDDGWLEQLLALPRDRELAFLCHHGVRSAHAAAHFAGHGFTATHNVVGGIDAWSEQLDPAVPRY